LQEQLWKSVWQAKQQLRLPAVHLRISALLKLRLPADVRLRVSADIELRFYAVVELRLQVRLPAHGQLCPDDDCLLRDGLDFVQRSAGVGNCSARIRRTGNDRKLRPAGPQCSGAGSRARQLKFIRRKGRLNISPAVA
jgi:hypothetical protein